MMFKRYADELSSPRSVVTRFPFGRPLGEPSKPDQHRVIIDDALRFLAEARKPGQVLELPYLWRREDFSAILDARGARQLAE